MTIVHDSMADALREVIQNAGGYKAIGLLFWPEMSVEQAAGNVRDRLNPGRRERFTPEQVLCIMRLGRKAGCHALAEYMALEAGYSVPVPVDPHDEIARLRRECIEAARTQSEKLAQIELLERQTESSLRRVA